MLKKIKLLAAWKGFAKDSVVEVEETVADTLVEAAIAKMFDENAEAEAANAKAAMQEMVQKGVMEAIRGIKVPSMNLHVEVKEPEPRVYKSLGEQLHDVMLSATGTRTKSLNEYVEKAPSGASEIIDADGGYRVQKDFQDELFAVLQQGAVLASKAQHTRVSGNGLRWNELDSYDRTAGNRPANVYRTEEAGTTTASKAKFIPRSMQLHKLVGVYDATEEILEDLPALEGEIRDWFAEEFPLVVDNEIVRGNGVGQMQGILGSPALVTVTKSAARSAAALAVDIPAMYARMHTGSLKSAEWFVNQAVLPYLLGMTVGDEPVYLPPGRFNDAPYGMLFGRPLNFIEQASALGSVGDIMFLDMNQYKIIEKSAGVTAASSIHVLFDSGQTRFRFSIRNNGAPKWSKVLTPADGSAVTRSPYVVLGA